MIVIATNNGFLLLKELLDSMKGMDMCGEKILVVDTISTSQEHLDFLKNIQTHYPEFEIEVCQTPYRGFDTGAYIYAYKNYPSEQYFFLHDSITVTDHNFIKDVKEHLKNHRVVAYNCFGFIGFGDAEWREFFKKNTGEDAYKMGIFGPMFACNRNVLDSVDFSKLELPKTKNQQACYEGIWYTIFDQNKIDVFILDAFKGRFSSRYLNKKIIHRG